MDKVSQAFIESMDYGDGNGWYLINEDLQKKVRTIYPKPEKKKLEENDREIKKSS